jgi:DMSO/TMAO reductase YedYZ molybdopterin-dependent catalytic subunit
MAEHVALPPHQQLAALEKWPVVGEQTAALHQPQEIWQVRITGLVATACSWTLAELAALPQVSRLMDIHCVTRWSKIAMQFGGVPLRVLLDECRPLPEARYLSFVARSTRGHSTSLPLADALALDPLVTLRHEGQTLAAEHGGPVRILVPGRYLYKSVKWLEEIRVLADDHLGYWEREAGYHNEADPWKEQRYLVPEVSHADAQALLQRRNISGRTMLGLRAEGQHLTGLQARGATLRDAHFEEAQLANACFDGANLSNAHFEGANLQAASFRSVAGNGADVEGANFRGANLRGVDFTAASLFGVTFCPEDES